MNKRNYQNSVVKDLQVSWAQFAPEPLFTTAAKVTGARRQGVNYERKAQDYIEMSLAQRRVMNDSLIYIKSPWLCYKNGSLTGKTYLCQPDGLIVELKEKKLTIIEIKLQHTAEAWYQVRKLYQPVLAVIYPGFQIAALEIVKWLDPHTPFPETFKFCDDVVYFDVDKFGVHIFNSGR